jgi:hypothetical protein
MFKWKPKRPVTSWEKTNNKIFLKSVLVDFVAHRHIHNKLIENKQEKQTSVQAPIFTSLSFHQINKTNT